MNRRDLLAASAVLLVHPSRTWPREAPNFSLSPLKKPVVLCWNENPYGPSPAARAQLTRSIADSCRYPIEEIDALNQAIADKEGVSTDQVVLGTGSGELLCALGRLASGHGSSDANEIVAALPTYTELMSYAQRAGAKVQFVPVDSSLKLDLGAMRAAVGKKTSAVYVCNPNNPTSTAVSSEALRDFAQSLPEQVLLIIDEAYLDFARGEHIESGTSLASMGRRVAVLKTFSKIHGMAGLRCGYAVTRPDIAAELADLRMTSLNILTVRAALASLADAAYLRETKSQLLKDRDKLSASLRSQGFRVADSQTNFLFFDTRMPINRFQDLMRARGFLVGRRFMPFDTWCRLTIGTAAEISAFDEAFRSLS